MNNILVHDVGAEKDAITALRSPTHFGRPNVSTTDRHRRIMGRGPPAHRCSGTGSSSLLPISTPIPTAACSSAVQLGWPPS